MPKKYSITYPTAKADVLALVEKGILREIPDVRPKAYFAPSIFEIAYTE
ncbi:MAG TPA: hypothetical protein PLT20_04125 [Sedimentisphaerales bacterium]|nr:hypothetical protein [Sedimentisphaerales bacterium]